VEPPTRTIEDEDVHSRDGTCILGSLPLLRAGVRFGEEGATEKTRSGKRKRI
jgi:hypothetical protein